MIDYKWPTAGDEPCPLEKDRIGNREIWLYWARAAERELSELEFEQRIQGLPESARVLLRFARERGLI